MSKVVFTSNDTPTLGIELEFGLVDAGTMALSNSIGQVLDQLPRAEVAYFKPELMQSCIEVNTGICDTVGEAEIDLRKKIEMVQRVMEPMGLHLWWGGTHPFSLWRDQQVTPDDRYAMLVSLLQEMARRVGLDGDAFDFCLDSGAKAQRVLQDFQEGQNYGVRATPTFFINGRKIVGFLPFEEFKSIVDQAAGG